MELNNPTVKNKNFNLKRPDSVRVMVFQPKTKLKDWEEKNGLYYPQNIIKFKKGVYAVLKKAEKERVNLIVFPELSITKECIHLIKRWSQNRESIVIVAGSHYDEKKQKNTDSEIVSKCPVIYNGKANYTEKIDPAPAELKPFPQKSLNSGNIILIFNNTPAGNFAVLVCSDNLTDRKNGAKSKIKKYNLDFWVVISFQRNSDWHFNEISNDVVGANGRFIIYCNNKVEEYADGRSSFFGIVNKEFYNSLKEKKHIDGKVKNQIICLKDNEDYFILDFDINQTTSEPENRLNFTLNVNLIDVNYLS